MTLKLEKISKSFGLHKVLSEVNLEISEGDFVAIYGGNGSGKSTLMNIISGRLKPSTGQISLNGLNTMRLNSKSLAGEGIVLLPQQPQIFDELNLRDNFVAKATLFDLSLKEAKLSAEKSIQYLNDILGTKFLPTTAVNDLTDEVRQLIEFAALVSIDVKFLLVDETTSPLDPNLAQIILTELLKMKDRGVGVVLITHRITEIKKYASQAYKLANGKLGDLDEDHRPSKHNSKQSKRYGVAISLKKYRPLTDSKPITATLHYGEVIGIFGYLGSGVTLVGKQLISKDNNYSGNIDIPRSEISYLGRNRHADNEYFGQDVTFNISSTSDLPTYVNGDFLAGYYDSAIQNFGISSPSASSPIGALSGGNRVKVAVARSMTRKRKIKILDEPFTGVDREARSQIKSAAQKIAQEGNVVVLISRELEDLKDCSSELIMLG